MRLLAAGLFVFLGILTALLIASRFSVSAPEWLAIPLFVIVFFGLIGTALVIFNRGGKPTVGVTESVEELRRRGLISTEVIEARRAFSVEQYEDEGPHCFFELKDGRVLYLSGQYLYDYCDDEAGNRHFPSSEFEIHRHKTQGYVVKIVARGVALPLDLNGIFNDKASGLEFPEDGEIVADKTYDQFKQEIRAVIDPIEAS
jgi:hypothetical protein